MGPPQVFFGAHYDTGGFMVGRGRRRWGGWSAASHRLLFFLIHAFTFTPTGKDLVRQSEAAQSEVEAAPSCGFMKPRFMKQEK